METLKQILRKPVAAVAALNAGVAILAFIKDILLAAYTGTSVEADALTIAYFLPDSIGNNVLAAAIAVVCVPLFSRLSATGGPARFKRTIRSAAVFFLALSAVMCLAGYWFSESLIGWFAASETGQNLAGQALPLLRILLPSILLFMVIAVGTAVLQTLDRFMIPAMAPMIGHLAVIATAVGLMVSGVSARLGVRWIAVSLTGGFVVMAIVIGVAWALAVRRGVMPERREEDRSPAEGGSDLVEMLRQLVPYAIVLLSMQAVYLAERFLLTNHESGAAAALNYAFRLSQLPIWVFVAAISVVMLPSLTRHLALGETNLAERVMSQAFQNTVLIVLPLMLYLFVLREPITVALFQRGAFDARSVALTTGLLAGYSLTILSQAFSFVVLRYFLARRKLLPAMLIYVAGGLLTVLLDLAFLPLAGVPAIGYGAAIGSLVNALFLYLLYRKIGGQAGASGAPGWLGNVLRVMAVPALMLALFGLVWKMWSHGLAGVVPGFAPGFVVVTGSLYLAVYFLLVKRFWKDSIEWLLGKGERG